MHFFDSLGGEDDPNNEKCSVGIKFGLGKLLSIELSVMTSGSS
jgi:hypothetical protein